MNEVNRLFLRVTEEYPDPRLELSPPELGDLSEGSGEAVRRRLQDEVLLNLCFARMIEMEQLILNVLPGREDR